MANKYTSPILIVSLLFHSTIQIGTLSLLYRYITVNLSVLFAFMELFTDKSLHISDNLTISNLTVKICENS